MVFKVKDTIKEVVAPAIITGTIIGSSIFNPTYAQNNQKKNANPDPCDSIKVKRSNYYEQTREEKLKQIHPTDNRIMPKVDVDSTQHVTEIITDLTNGILAHPVGITMNLYYGQDKALDLNNLPNKKPGYILKFKEKSIDDVFKSIYNGIDKYYSHSDDVLNKAQIIKNFRELEILVKKHESKDTDWGLYIKDGNIFAYEFKNLDKGFYGVEVTAIDIKSGKIVETLEGLVNRGEDYSDNVKIVPKEVPVPYPVEVPVYRDTCITPPEEPDNSCNFGVKNLTVGLGETMYDKKMLQARLGIGDCDLEAGVRVGYSGEKYTPDEYKFRSSFGNTEVYQNQELLAGVDITARIINNIRLGLGVNYRWNDFRVDEELYDHAGNLKKSKEGAKVPALNKEKNHPGLTGTLSYSIGVIRIEGGVEIAKGYDPKKFVGVGVNF